MGAEDCRQAGDDAGISEAAGAGLVSQGLWVAGAVEVVRSVAGYTEVSPDVADSALIRGERMDVHGPVLPRPVQHRIPPAENHGGMGQPLS